MAIFRSKITPPPRLRSRFPAGLKIEVLEPIGGINTAAAPQNLPPSQTPFSQNLTADGREMRPRSGLSQYGSSQILSSPNAVIKFSDVVGTDYHIAISDQTSSIRSTTGSDWQVITGTPSTNTYLSWDWGYSPSFDENLVVITDGSQTPYYFSPVFSSWQPLSDFTSHESFARYVTFFDNRLIFFNMGSSSTLPFSTRVRWSVRGDPLDFTSSGAGFEDLVTMRGYGTGIMAESDRIVIFSDEEVWIGRPRRDQYAFEFFPLAREVGNPFPRTATVTDKGVMWLDKEYRFRLLSGNQLYTFTDSTRKMLLDELREPGEAWATFNPEDGRFEFYFSDTTGEAASRALWLRTSTIVSSPENPSLLEGVWEHQDFGSHQLPAGNNGVYLSSAATPYRLLSSQPTDDGQALDWRWRTPALRIGRDQDRRERITDLWIDYKGTSASSISIYHSSDLGASWTDLGAVAAGSGRGTIHTSLAAPSSRFNQIELRGTGSDPAISSIRIQLRQFSGRAV